MAQFLRAMPVPSQIPMHVRLTLLAATLWTMALAASLMWNIQNGRQQLIDQAYAEARANLSKDITFRRWGTRHGGVYVPVTPTQQSVPGLSHVPGRDVTTTDGLKLTLLNPATMLRQMMDDYADAYGVRGRITGLKYLNPANAPDSWETLQLQAFSRGDKTETWEIANLGGKPYLRHLRAMFMEDGCEKCHAILGYKTGDLRGATGLNLPLAPYYSQIESATTNFTLSHGAIWLLGLAGLGWANRLARQRDLERQARNELALQAREEIDRLSLRNQILLDAAGEGIFGIDHQGRTTYINPAALELLGFRQDEVLGQDAHALFHHTRTDGSAYPKEYCPLHRTLADGARFEAEDAFIRKSGEFFAVRMVVTPMLDNHRQVGAEVIFEDITERKRSIALLQESEARLRSIFEASPVPYALNDDQQNIIWLNPVFVRTFGYSLEDIPTLAEWWSRAYPAPEYRAWVAAEYPRRIEDARRKDAPFQPMQLDIRCKDGSTRTVLASAAQLGGASSGLHLVILFDITEHKKHEEQLLKLSLAIEQSPESVVITDLDGNIEYINDAFVHNTGYSREEVLGRNPRILQSGKMPAATFVEMWASLTQGQSWKGELINVRKDGSEFIESAIISPVRQPDGRMTHYVAVKQDITEKKLAEIQFKQLNENLEQRVSEETAKNWEKSKLLIQQSRLAAMGETIHNIAHQWRQPINALNLLLGNIKDAYKFDELDQEYLDREVEIGNRLIQKMSNTIDDFRDFFEPGGKKCLFSVNKAAENACRILAASLESHGISIELKAGAEIFISGYPNDYAQVVLNLLSNAKDAFIKRQIAQPHIEITIGDNQGNAELLVSDNAGGIAEEMLPKVFEPYFTTKEMGGLGLYMSKLIIENNMGGQIVASNNQSGATFLISCPLERKSTEASDA